MTALDEAFQKLKSLLDEHPAAASAGLIALAVEREVLKESDARSLASKLDLDDFERVKAVLARELKDRGRSQELVALLQEARRIQRRAEKLLKRAGG